MKLQSEGVEMNYVALCSSWDCDSNTFGARIRAQVYLSMQY